MKKNFQPAKRSTTRAKVRTIPSTSTCFLPALCIFCGKIRKKVKGKWENFGNSESRNAEITIRNAAATLNDQALLLMIGNYKFGDGPDFVAKKIKYHQSCRRDCTNRIRVLEKSVVSLNKTNADFKKQALSHLKEYIRNTIIEKNSSEFVSNLVSCFKNSFKAASGETNFLDTYTLQNFCSMLKKNFSNEELTIAAENTEKTLAYKTGLDLEEAYTCANLKSSEDRSSEIWKCALLMRKKILNNNINPLEEPVTVAGIMKGEAKIPDEVYMYTGSDSENDLTIRKVRLIESSAADTVYAYSGGKQLTGKQLSLGIQNGIFNIFDERIRRSNFCSYYRRQDFLLFS